jgi:hypothetical protein
MDKGRRELIAIDQRIELYFEAHPGGPAAMRRPRVSKQGGVWVALLGPNVQSGVAGIGSTVEAALAAFDRQYLLRLRPMAA